jgi:RTX calcium-binding nonapeptide repeat (4 copies)
MRYEVPAAGIITSWSFRADAEPPDLKLKVGRPTDTGPLTGSAEFTIIGGSSEVSPVPNELNTYPAKISVHRGDVIGDFTATEGKCEQEAPGYAIYVKSGEVLAGQKSLFVDDGNYQLDISAVLKPYKCARRNATMGGTAGNDTLVGTSGADVIVGLEGNDGIRGLAGGDRICGVEAQDRLKGGSGNDILKGGRGADRLNGGRGRDKCVGGPGDDKAKNCEIKRSL